MTWEVWGKARATIFYKTLRYFRGAPLFEKLNGRKADSNTEILKLRLSSRDAKKMFQMDLRRVKF